MDIITENFIGSKIKQKSGEILEVLNKENSIAYRVKSSLYNNEFITYKSSLLKKSVQNPKYFEYTFLNKEYTQNNGEILKVLSIRHEKCNRQIYFTVKSLKYNNIFECRKDKILEGSVLNPKEDDFILVGKSFKMNYNQDLFVIKKTSLKDKYTGAYLFECEFKNPYYKILVRKNLILSGKVYNKNLPWLNKDKLISYIKNNLGERENLSLIDIHNHFYINYNYKNIDRTLREYKIREQVCKDGIISISREENTLKDFIKSFYKGKIITYHGNKDDKFLEIDIYLPELKIGFEYNGTYWHSDINKDKIKQEHFKNKGIEIFIIWDYFWFENLNNRFKPKESSKEYVKNIILKYQNLFKDGQIK